MKRRKITKRYLIHYKSLNGATETSIVYKTKKPIRTNKKIGELEKEISNIKNKEGLILNIVELI